MAEKTIEGLAVVNHSGQDGEVNKGEWIFELDYLEEIVCFCIRISSDGCNSVTRLRPSKDF